MDYAGSRWLTLAHAGSRWLTLAHAGSRWSTLEYATEHDRTRQKETKTPLDNVKYMCYSTHNEKPTPANRATD